MASIFKAGKRWRVQIRRTGRPALSEYFDSKQDAQRWARAQESDIDRGRMAVDGLKTTVRDVMDAYDKAFPDKVNRQRMSVRRQLEPHFGAIRLNELGTQAVINFANLRERDGASPSTILHNLSFLQSYIKFGTQVLGAMDFGALAKARLSAAISLLGHSGQAAPSNVRNRRPTDEELKTLHAIFCANGHARKDGLLIWSMILFAIATAMRLGEITALRREDLNIEEKVIWIRDRKDPRQKRGNDQLIPLLTGHFKFDGVFVDPLEILLQQPVSEVTPHLFFGVRSNSVSKVFGGALAGHIDNLHFHDLRHDGISRLFEAGYDIPRVALVSGHKKWTSLKRYTNLRAADLHDFNANAHQSSARKINA